MYIEREYSLVNLIFIAEAITLSPVVLEANANTGHTKLTQLTTLTTISYLVLKFY